MDLNCPPPSTIRRRFRRELYMGVSRNLNPRQTSHRYSRDEGSGSFAISCGYSAVSFEFMEKVLHRDSLFVEPSIKLARPTGVAFCGNYRLHSRVDNSFVYRIRMVSAVSNERFPFCYRNERHCHCRIMAITLRKS